MRERQWSRQVATSLEPHAQTTSRTVDGMLEGIRPRAVRGLDHISPWPTRQSLSRSTLSDASNHLDIPGMQCVLTTSLPTTCARARTGRAPSVQLAGCLSRCPRTARDGSPPRPIIPSVLHYASMWKRQKRVVAKACEPGTTDRRQQSWNHVLGSVGLPKALGGHRESAVCPTRRYPPSRRSTAPSRGNRHPKPRWHVLRHVGHQARRAFFTSSMNHMEGKTLHGVLREER